MHELQCSVENRPEFLLEPFENAVSPPWYCIQSNPQQESRAQLNLSRWCETYLPTYSITCSNCRGKSKCPRCGGKGIVVRPVFTGYLFARFPEHLAGKVTVNYGVRRIIEFGGVLAEVPDSVICDLRYWLHRSTEELFATFKLGQKVRFRSPAWEGFVAEIAQLDCNGKIRVLMQAMGGERAMTVEACDLVRA